MSRPHPYYDRWEPEPPEEPEPRRRWLLLIVGTLVGACLVVACAAGGYFVLQPLLAQPTLPAPPVVPTLEGAEQTATSQAVLEGGGVAPADGTQPPAATVTLPAQAGDLVAPFISQAPVIDGALADWPGTVSARSAHRVYAYSGWDGSSDLDATWQLAWDEGRLYVAVQVSDDVHVQTQEGQRIYQGDSVEIQIDINPDANATRVNPATSQIILSPGDFEGSPGASAARFRGDNDGELPHAPGHSIEVAAQQTAEGYVLEAAIPWADVNLTPAAGMRLGLALNANDNDSPGVARQEVMMSSEPGRTLTNPSTWGTLLLENATGEE